MMIGQDSVEGLSWKDKNLLQMVIVGSTLASLDFGQYWTLTTVNATFRTTPRLFTTPRGWDSTADRNLAPLIGPEIWGDSATRSRSSTWPEWETRDLPPLS
jgi:hypothetical protein